MASGFATRCAAALLLACLATAARADDETPQPQPSPSAQAPGSQNPSGQKGRAGRGEGGGYAANAAGNASAPEQHRLPPDSTTKQSVALPGRTLAFGATAGSIRVFDDKGEPLADIAYTSYQLDGAEKAYRSAIRTGHPHARKHLVGMYRFVRKDEGAARALEGECPGRH